MMVCVRQGKRYGPEYVRVMANMIASVDPGESLVVLTDQPDTGTERKTVTARPLKENLEGWWAKMELFAPWNRDLRPFLYIDLDCFLLDDPAPLKNRDGLYLIQEFNKQRQWKESNSSLIWVPAADGESDDIDTIWRHFMIDRPDKRAQFRGSDQRFISRYPHGMYTAEDGVYSYKAENIRTVRPCDARVIAFHGQPKPPDTEGWAKRMWESYKA